MDTGEHAAFSFRFDQASLSLWQTGIEVMSTAGAPLPWKVQDGTSLFRGPGQLEVPWPYRRNLQGIAREPSPFAVTTRSQTMAAMVERFT